MSKLSIEFFPPKTEQGLYKLHTTQEILSTLNPEYYSVTYGAGGSTHQGTWNTVLEMHLKNLEVAPHLSCVGATREQLKRLLFAYRSAGIRKIVALRGDLPSGTAFYGDCRYASDLVDLIREHTDDWFDIKVAAYPEMHPQAKTYQADLKNFITKMNAGANSAITQYFYTADAFFDFLNQVRQKGINQPIIAGIMPIQNYSQLKRFSEMCGADIPRWLEKRLIDLEDDPKSLIDFGQEVVTRLCQQLLDADVDGLHFYTLNHSEPTLNIVKQLSFKNPLSPKGN
jgi:methylenetetrahydrofolate reductase (NADPH)